MPALIETRDLARHYQMGHTVVRALDGVSIAINAGEFVALVGASGSGKSTLLNLLAGLDRPTGGMLSVFGHDVSRMSREELTNHRRKNVGIIFQSFNLVSTMTASDNVALAMMFAGVPRAERDSRAHDLLAKMGLEGRQQHRPKELSGGEQQRVAIARAVINRPELLVADEPTGNVDAEMAQRLLHLFTALNRLGTTVVVATHDIGLIKATPGAQLIRLESGTMVDPTGVLKNPPPVTRGGF
jgi:cell division transport system ATP-binding protein